MAADSRSPSEGPTSADKGELSSLRLFVAIDLNEEVKNALRRRLSNLRGQLPRSRWVDPDQAHLTLVFLGNTSHDLLPDLEAALQPAFAEFPPFAMRLHGGGTFPQGRPARVAWVGIRAGAVLVPLQQKVAAASSRFLNREPERRPFHPHVTLTRCNPPWPRRVVERFQQEVAHGSWGEEMEVREGLLFSSLLGPRGAQHQVRARFPLRGQG